jgi:hypothetical protein
VARSSESNLAEDMKIFGRKTYNGEKAASSTNVAGKTGYLPTEN